MREFNTKVEKDVYSITFETDDEKAYQQVQTLCRLLIDGKSGEAIPIEWIINWLNKQTIPALRTCDDDYEAVNIMLDDWEKENEQNKKNTSQAD
jgi:hypothetical protein